MKIVWLEDDLKTIRSSMNYIQEKIGVKAQICENFSEFSDALELLEDLPENVIIIDIRMLFNMEITFSCFDKTFHVDEELNGGFEYFKECIEGRFTKARVLFFTSKPLEEAKKDARKFNISTSLIITKDNLHALLRVLRSSYEN